MAPRMLDKEAAMALAAPFPPRSPARPEFVTIALWLSGDVVDEGLHLEDFGGDGPPMLLLHGWAMHSGVFAPALPHLQQRFHVYALDLPGHGYSRTCTLPLTGAALWTALQARMPPALWLGWSLGGLLALEAALHVDALRSGSAITSTPTVAMAGSIMGLVMCGASPRFTVSPSWPHGMPAQVFEDFADGLAHRFERTIDRFLALETLGAAHAHEDLKRLKAEVFAHGRPELRALHEGLEALRSRDLAADLPRLTVPTLWLAGRRDRLVSPDAVLQATRLANDAEVEVFEQAAHAPFMTHPEAFAERISLWYRRRS